MNEPTLHASKEQLAALLSASRWLTESIHLDTLLKRIVRSVSGLLSCEAGSVLLIDPCTNELTFRVVLGTEGTVLQNVRLKMGEGVAGWVAQHRRPVVINDVAADVRFSPKVDRITGFKTKSILAVPLLDRDRVLGVLEVLNTSKGRRFEEEDLTFLTAFGSHVSVALRNAQLFSAMQAEKERLRTALAERYRTLIAESPNMKDIVTLAKRAARSNATVLILGESGVGKEIVARFIHAWSERADKPFIPVNCVALSDHLLESELFGHEKGSFTGAHEQKKGFLEVAQGGTIFLDEIGDMKPELQAKLLRVLQDRTFERVGSTTPIAVDIRVLAATNQDLKAAVRSGRFRKDLYYRLNVVTMTLPPLRERRKDIPALANHFVAYYAREMKRRQPEIDPDAMKLLEDYDWPGNVRELQNILERAMALASDERITAKDIVLDKLAHEAKPADTLLLLPFHSSVEQFKRMRLEEAIARAGGNKTRAAQQLELQRTYLNRLCRQMGIS
jgi:Nif-specific regulatory protein